jgi:hypothetical protein
VCGADEGSPSLRLAWVRVAHGERGLAQRVWGLCVEESRDAVLVGDELVVCLTGEFRCVVIVDLPERGHDYYGSRISLAD